LNSAAITNRRKEGRTVKSIGVKGKENKKERKSNECKTAATLDTDQMREVNQIVRSNCDSTINLSEEEESDDLLEVSCLSNHRARDADDEEDDEEEEEDDDDEEEDEEDDEDEMEEDEDDEEEEYVFGEQPEVTDKMANEEEDDGDDEMEDAADDNDDDDEGGESERSIDVDISDDEERRRRRRRTKKSRAEVDDKSSTDSPLMNGRQTNVINKVKGPKASKKTIMIINKKKRKRILMSQEQSAAKVETGSEGKNSKSTNFSIEMLLNCRQDDKKSSDRNNNLAVSLEPEVTDADKFDAAVLEMYRQKYGELVKVSCQTESSLFLNV
jgi:hypothetical protein